ncbi:MAG: acylneuraminate cytidylyltransferase family protein [Bacteroidota bacterium]
MKTLVLITARGGSKGIPNKNIKPLAGKPLLNYSIEAALEVFNAADICVSTDSAEIKVVAENAGLVVPFLRPAELAADNSGSNEVILHAIKFYEAAGKNYDTLLLLQPTSPFRKKEHIEAAMAMYGPETEMITGVTETAANPYSVLYEEDENGFLQRSKTSNAIRRQDCPAVWQMNGAIYLINIQALKAKGSIALLKKKKFEMDQVSSLDIDTPLDWMFAEFVLERLKHDAER